MSRESLLKELKKIGVTVSLIAVMVGASALAGCKDNDKLDTYYKVLEDRYIVIDGVLHYGDVCTSKSSYSWANTDILYYELAEHPGFFSNEKFKIFSGDEKPDEVFYESECRDCMTHVD